MPRLFISHSSKDNIQALAFQRWLEAAGWTKNDVFLDLHGIGAGERWRDTLRKANASCEAVILLASPDSLDSVECQKELELAEALGKAIIPTILRDLGKDDPRLARYSERQFVDLITFPQDHIETIQFEGRSHRIGFSSQALSSIKARLDDLGISPGSFAWPPKNKPDAEPYPGLSAFDENDAGIFFGRDADIMSGLTELRLVRRRGAPRLIIIQAASGAGKSSFLRGGLWPRLNRDSDFAPLAIVRPSQGVLTGPNGLGRHLAPWFTRYGKVKTAGEIHRILNAADQMAASDGLRVLLAEAAALTASVRRAAVPDATTPSLILAIDQGEELFAAENSDESRRFLSLLRPLLNQPPEGVDLYVLITIRADSVECLLSQVADLELEAPKPIYLPPLSPAAYRDVILKPAAVYSERIRRLSIEPALADRLVADATGADALPLLAFALSQLYQAYAPGRELTISQYNEIGGIDGCISKVLKQAQVAAGTAGSDENLRRLIVPRLASWDPDADGGRGAAKRLVARESDVTGGERAPLTPLAAALVEARLLTRNRDTLEVSHEALLRQPPISKWLDEDREFLIWRDRLGKARAAFEANQRGLLIGRELRIASDWLRDRPPDDISEANRLFINSSLEDSTKQTANERAREKLRTRAAVIAMVFATILIATQSALYLGSEERIAAIMDRSFADLWIVPFGTKSFDDPSLLPGRERYAALSTEGVVEVQDLVVGYGSWKNERIGNKTVMLVGSSWATGGFSPWNIVDGSLECAHCAVNSCDRPFVFSGFRGQLY